MQDSPFEHISETAPYFTTPQLEDIFQSVLSDIQNLRLLSCVIGFPKSGKTFFLNRLKSAQQAHTVLLTASSGHSLSRILNRHLSPEKENKPVLAHLLRKNKHVVLFIDNAHLLTDEDFAFLGGLFTLAEHLQGVLQVVLIGNGEIVHKLARPDNRAMYTMLSSLWNLPKLTREQSMDYIRFLLDGAGLASELISNPEALAKRAAGVIGILRMLTITLALRSLNSHDSCDAEAALNPPSPANPVQEESPDEDMPVQTMVTSMSPWTGMFLALSMAGIIGLFLLFFSWLIPGGGMNDLFNGFKSTSRSVTDTAPPASLAPSAHVEAATDPAPQTVAKTVFRKRTKDGPYSLQLGSYPTMESLLLHLPRFTDQQLPLFWNRDLDQNPRFSLFVGRFESFEQAEKFASQNRLKDSPVVFRPFVATVGPLTDPRQIKSASRSIGLPQQHAVFERELVTGVEIQFALERSREDALAHCAEAEKKGLSCAVTQYD